MDKQSEIFSFRLPEQLPTQRKFRPHRFLSSAEMKRTIIHRTVGFVLRGGALNSAPQFSDSACRFHDKPGQTFYLTGFRLVMG